MLGHAVVRTSISNQGEHQAVVAQLLQPRA